MTTKILPPLVNRNSFDTLEDFLAELYKIFLDDFVNQNTYFKSQRVFVRKRPMSDLDNKLYDWTFHHIITKDSPEKIRALDLGRAERIKFPKFYIDNHNSLNVWSRRKNNETKFYISDLNFDYLVVLSQRKSYLMLLSAFVLETNHYKRKMRKEFDQYKIL